MVTINKPDDMSDSVFYRQVGTFFTRKNIVSKCYQFERGEEEQRLHSHGVVRFRNSVAFNTIKGSLNRCGFSSIFLRAIGDTSAWERACKYCCKEDTRVSGPTFSGIDVWMVVCDLFAD